MADGGRQIAAEQPIEEGHDHEDEQRQAEQPACRLQQHADAEEGDEDVGVAIGHQHRREFIRRADEVPDGDCESGDRCYVRQPGERQEEFSPLWNGSRQRASKQDRDDRGIDDQRARIGNVINADIGHDDGIDGQRQPEGRRHISENPRWQGDHASPAEAKTESRRDAGRCVFILPPLVPGTIRLLAAGKRVRGCLGLMRGVALDYF